LKSETWQKSSLTKNKLGETMNNILIFIGSLFVTYMLFTHPTTKKVQKCMKAEIIIDTDEIIDDIADKAKNVTKKLDKKD